MEFLVFAVVALLGFGFHDFVIKLLSAHMAAPLIAGIAAIIGGISLLVYTSIQGMFPSADRFTLYAVLVGLLFGVAYAAYVLTIAKGPLSVAMPIVALWFVISAALGILFLHEGLTVTKGTGIVFAGAAIFLLTRG